MSSARTPPYGPIRIALVSGKGGSGKTMILASLARILDTKHNDITDLLVPGITLIDTDIGTGGLSYYFSINYSRGIGIGLSELLLRETMTIAPEIMMPLNTFQDTRLVSVGDLRKLQSDRAYASTSEGSLVRDRMGECLDRIQSFGSTGITLIDCRGGIDDESIEVCKFVDDIIIVAETDPASFQATQNLANVLSDRGLISKVRGFIINRVFADPTSLIHTATPAFRAPFLGAVPFDLSAIQSFHVGRLPAIDSPFVTHVWHAFYRAYPYFPKPPGEPWDLRRIGSLDIGDTDSLAGSLAFMTLSIGLIGAAFLRAWTHSLAYPFESSILGNPAFILLWAGAVAAILGSVGALRRATGRSLTKCLRRGLLLWAKLSG